MTDLRVAVIAPAGSGKSTCAGIIEDEARRRGLSVARVKLATPLYDLQAEVYARSGGALPAGAQDQVLMESLADAMRRINPSALADDFVRRLAGVHADVVINDDLRDPHIDAPVLRRLGFRVLRVRCDETQRQKRLAERGDPTRADRSTRELDLIEPDADVDNSGEPEQCRTVVTDLMRSWL